MSRFHGRQGPGALQRHRDRLYDEALARQAALIERGSYPRAVRLSYRDGDDDMLSLRPGYPAPLECFERQPSAALHLAELRHAAGYPAVSDGR